MKALIWLVSCLMLGAGVAFGQPADSMPIDTSLAIAPPPEAPSVPGLLNKSRSRGIDLSFNFINGGVMHPPGGGPEALRSQLHALQSMTLKLKVPLVLTPGFKLLLGYTYRPEKYFYTESGLAERPSLISPDVRYVFQQMDNRLLKQNSYNLYGMKPFKNRRYFAFRMSLAFSGDYAGWMTLDSRYAIFRASLTYGIRKHRDLEYGFGLAFSHSFRRTIALPFFLFFHNFNAHWGMESVFPLYINGRYNLDPKTIFLFGARAAGGNYSIDLRDQLTGQTHVYHLNHDELRLGVSLERQIVPWVWLNIRAGFQFSLPTRFRPAEDGLPSYSAVPGSTPYLSTGLFISPPSDLRR